MKPVASDMSLFFRRARGQVTGLLASYVDDTLACGDRSFSDLTKKTRVKFEVKSREYHNMRFSGVYVDKTNEGFEIHQRAYIDRLQSYLVTRTSSSSAVLAQGCLGSSIQDLTSVSQQASWLKSQKRRSKSLTSNSSTKPLTICWQLETCPCACANGP